MRQVFSRRHVVQSLLAGAAGLAGLPARAGASTGKVYFGFAQRWVPGMPELLAAMRDHYEPRLELDLALVPGNSGARVLEAVLAAPADGCAVLLSPSGAMTLLPHLRTLPGADPVNDFVPVAALGQFTLALVVGPAVPAEVKDAIGYVEWVRRNPASANFGSPGLGISPHLAGVTMARTVGLQLKATAYQSLVPMLKDVIAGAVPAGFTIVGAAPELLQDPRLRLLGVTSRQRWPGVPHVPTLIEQGVSNEAVVESWGLFLSARTPAAKVRELNSAVLEAQRTPAFTEAMRAAQLFIEPLTAEQYADLLARERAGWAAVVKRERLSMQG